MMKNHIKKLEALKQSTVGFDESLDLAILALEKQEVKPPEYKVHEKYPSLGKNYYCSSCGVMFIDFENNSTNYCGNCGQKLKADDSEEN